MDIKLFIISFSPKLPELVVSHAQKSTSQSGSTLFSGAYIEQVKHYIFLFDYLILINSHFSVLHHYDKPFS